MQFFADNAYKFSWHETPNGYLKLKAKIAKKCVNKYVIDGKTVSVLRGTEINDQEFLDSVLSSPAVNDHPLTPKGGTILLDTGNTRLYQVGFPHGSTWQDGKYLCNELIISDSQTIADIKNGKDKISLGTKGKLRKCPGVFEGVPYDFVVDNPRCNHQAICYNPRSGDQEIGFTDSLDHEIQDIGAKNMATLKIGDKNLEVEESVKDAVTSHLAIIENELKKARESSDKFEALSDSRDSELQKLKKASEKINYQEFLEFRTLLDTAEEVLPQELFDSIDFSSDDLNLTDIKRTILINQNPHLKEKYESKPDTFIDTAYEAFHDFTPGKNASEQGSGKDFGATLNDSRKNNNPGNDDGYAAQVKRARERHKSYQNQ